MNLLANLIYQNIVILNPLQLFIGAGLAMHIEAAVEYLKSNWRVPAQAAPYVASIFAFAVQFAACQFFHIPLTATLIGTIFTTAGACYWHELSTPSQGNS